MTARLLFSPPLLPRRTRDDAGAAHQQESEIRDCTDGLHLSEEKQKGERRKTCTPGDAPLDRLGRAMLPFLKEREDTKRLTDTPEGFPGCSQDLRLRERTRPPS